MRGDDERRDGDAGQDERLLRWRVRRDHHDTGAGPDGQNLDNYYLARPGVDEIQLDLFGDYKSNVALYSSFREKSSAIFWVSARASNNV